MDNPEKLATRRRQKKTTTQYVLDNTKPKEGQIT